MPRLFTQTHKSNRKDRGKLPRCIVGKKGGSYYPFWSYDKSKKETKRVKKGLILDTDTRFNLGLTLDTDTRH